MKISDVLNCSFPAWYSNFRSVTFKSVTIPLPKTFISYLHSDGVVLPEGSQCGLYGKSNNLAMDGDEDDEDVRDNELMKQYENDWSSSTNSEHLQAPDFDEFDKAVQAAIKSLGGQVFPKLNWSSPKDASWIAFDKSLRCTCPEEIYLLLKSSEFVAHDLDQPFIHCEDYNADLEPGSPDVTYFLVLRQWQPPDPSTEFRCFVSHKRIIGVSQRSSTQFYPCLAEDKPNILADIIMFFNKQIVDTFPDSEYIFDVVRTRKGKITLVDFNPYGAVTDTLMFSWKELDQLAAEVNLATASFQPSFRCVESEDGVQTSDYASYAFPQDIRDLVAGEDPYKLMDLMKLKIQSNNDSESESEDEATQTLEKT